MKSQKLVQWTGIVVLLSSLYGIVIQRVFLMGLYTTTIPQRDELSNLFLSTFFPLIIIKKKLATF